MQRVPSNELSERERFDLEVQRALTGDYAMTPHEFRQLFERIRRDATGDEASRAKRIRARATIVVAIAGAVSAVALGVTEALRALF